MFISYAQNREDVILWRALKDCSPGFYIDVGAAWPDHDSVTKAFYDQNWSGLNIEPNPRFIERLRQDRPRDINLPVAVSNRRGEAEFFLIDDTGISSLHENVALMHRDRGYNHQQVKVVVETLSQIWQQYVPLGQDVHFLKIDVEGHEPAVLEGLNWEEQRPWIIVVEAVLPGQQVENHETWEHLILQQRYRYVYHDGLNRYYLADEKEDLQKHFRYPPNVYDNFLAIDHWRAVAALEVAISKFKSDLLDEARLKANLELSQTEILRLQADMQKLHRQLNYLENENRRLEALVVTEKNHSQWQQTELDKHVHTIDDLTAQLLHARAETVAAHEQLQATYQSLSLKVTWPLRLLQKPFRRKTLAAAVPANGHQGAHNAQQISGPPSSRWEKAPPPTETSSLSEEFLGSLKKKGLLGVGDGQAQKILRQLQVLQDG